MRGSGVAVTDAALAALPQRIAGEPTRLGPGPDRSVVTPAPSVPVPPVLVGGNSDVAIRRAARYGDGWSPPSTLTRWPSARRICAPAAERERASRSITVGGHAMLGSDASARSARDAFVCGLGDDHGMTPEAAAPM